MATLVYILPALKGNGWEVWYNMRILFHEKDRGIAENKAHMYAKINGHETRTIHEPQEGTRGIPHPRE